jgi:hypothetical protein
MGTGQDRPAARNVCGRTGGSRTRYVLEQPPEVPTCPMSPSVTTYAIVHRVHERRGLPKIMDKECSIDSVVPSENAGCPRRRAQPCVNRKECPGTFSTT